MEELQPKISLQEAELRSKAWLRASYSLVGGPVVGAMLQYVLTAIDRNSLTISNVDPKKMAVSALLVGIPIIIAHWCTPPDQIGAAAARVRMFRGA